MPSWSRHYAYGVHKRVRGNDTVAEWLRRRPAKPMGFHRVGSNPTGVALQALGFPRTSGETMPRLRAQERAPGRREPAHVAPGGQHLLHYAAGPWRARACITRAYTRRRHLSYAQGHAPSLQRRAGCQCERFPCRAGGGMLRYVHPVASAIPYLLSSGAMRTPDRQPHVNAAVPQPAEQVL